MKIFARFQALGKVECGEIKTFEWSTPASGKHDQCSLPTNREKQLEADLPFLLISYLKNIFI